MENLTTKDTSLIFGKSFQDRLIEYFRPIWKAHSLDPNWMCQDTSHYATEERPFFHGLALSQDDMVLSGVRRNIKVLFSQNSMPFNMVGDNNVYSRAGEFTFLNVNDKRIGSLEKFLNGRLYDIIMVTTDILITEDMLRVLLTATVDKNPGRIVGKYDPELANRKLIDYITPGAIRLFRAPDDMRTES